MPTQVGGMYVGLTAEFQPYEQAFNRATATTEQGTARIRRATDLTAKSVTALERSMSGFGGGGGGTQFASLLFAGRAFENMSSRVSLLRGAMIAATGAFTGFTGALTTNVVARYADAYTNLNNQVLAVSRSSAEAKATFGGLAGVAERSRSSLEATTLLFSRISKASPDLDATTVLRYVETIQKAMQLGGATAQEARSAAIQFSQAIASNRLGGDELRAVLETPLGLDLAKGLGVSIGKLREMSIAGKLTAQTVLGALGNIAPSIDAKFTKMVVSVDQALTVADNKLTVYVGSVDKAYGITRNLGAAILAFGDNLNTIMPWVAAAGGVIAANLGSRLLLAPVRGISSGFTNEIKARREALAGLAVEARAAERQLVDAGLLRSNASVATFGDQARNASPATLSNIEREERVLKKLEDERLSLIEKQKKVQTDIASVTATMSPRAVTLAERQAKAEAAAADAVKAQAEAKKRIAQTTTRETAALGMNAVTGAGRDTVIESRRDRIKAERDYQAAIIDTARQQRVAATAADQIAKLTTDAEQRAAGQRIALIRNESSIRQQLGVNYVMRTGQSEDISALRGAAYQEGSVRSRETSRGANETFRIASENYRSVSGDLAIAAQRASAGAVAVTMLRTAWSGLIGALGGPWGIAITAAIAALGYLGARSMKTAQEMQEADKIIADFVARRAARTDLSVPDRREAQIDQINREIAAQEEKLRVTQGKASELSASLASEARYAVAPLFDTLSGTAAEFPVQRQINSLIADLRGGKLAFDDFVARLRDLGVSSTIIDQLISSVKKIPDEARNAAGSIQEIQDAIKKLDGQKATVTISVFGAVTPDLVRTVDEAKSAAEYLRKQDLELKAKTLAAGGDKLSLYRFEATKEATTAGVKVSADDIEKMARQRVEVDKIQEATNKAKREAESASKAYEKLTDALARLGEEAKGSRLLDVDREVLTRAKGMKFSASDMEAYRKAAETGTFSGVNPDLMKLRAAETDKSSGAMYRELIQEYGTGAQLTRQFAQRQEELNRLVADGTITAGQAATEMGKYIASFGQYTWVTDMSSAIGNFAQSAASDFSSVSSSFSSMITNIKNALIKSAIAKPIENYFTGLLGSFAKSGLNLGSLFSSGSSVDFTGIYHDGAPLGHPTTMRAMPSAAFQYAPRYHQGMMPGELKAVLKHGETVLNDNLTGRVSSTMAGLADTAGSRSGVTVNVNNNAGAEVSTQERRTAGGTTIDLLIDQKVATKISQPGSDTYRALSGRGMRQELAKR